MSDAALNSTVNTAVVCLAAAVWAGAIVVLVALWSVIWSRRLLMVQATAVAILSLLLLPFFLWRTAVIIPMGTWLSLGGNETAVPIAFRIDAVGLTVLSAVALLVAALVLRPLERQPSLRSTLLHCAFFESALLFVLSGDLLFQLAFWQLTAVTLFLWKSHSGRAGFGDFEAAVTARRRFQFRLVADSCILLGVVAAVWGNTTGPAAGLSETLTSGGPLIALGVLLRSFCFPFFAACPVDSGSQNTESSVLDRLVVVPSGFYLLVRCAEFPGIAPIESGWLLSAGAALALIGSLVAAARVTHEFDLSGLSVALTGLLLAGVASGTASGIQGATVLFFTQAVVLFAAVRAHVARHGGQVLFAAASALFATGLAGTARVVSTLWRQIETGGGEQPAWLLLAVVVCLVTAHGVVSYVLFRRLRAIQRAKIASTDGDQQCGGLGGELLPVFMLTVAAAISLAGIVYPRAWWRSEVERLSGPPDYLLFALIALIGAIGAIAGWMRSPEQADTAERRKSSGRFRARLAAGFHLDETFLLWVSLPLRAAAMLLRFLEWFGIGQFKTAPNRIPDWAARFAAPLNTESSRFVVLSILLATAALLVTVVGWGGG